LKTREKKFIEFSARFNPDVIKRWDAVDDTPKTVGKEVIGVHRPKFNNSMSYSRVHIVNSSFYFRTTDASKSSSETPP